MKRLVAGLALVGAASAPVAAQEALLPSAGWGVGMGMSAWYFSESMPQAGGPLRAVAEFALPFRVRTVFGRWTMDLTGAGMYGAAAFIPPDSVEDGEGRLVSLAGPTDLKLRAGGPILGDNLLLTLGLNIPTGKVGLSADETNALQALGAPALRMPVASLGTGAGATIGLVRAFDLNGWALALGASAEQRSEYSPIALALASGTSETQITPGMAMHFTAGLDRPVGQSRLSLLLVSDIFSEDALAISDDPAAATSYTLGPQMTALTRLEFNGKGWRSGELQISARMRSQFSDAAGIKVEGSSGTYIEGSFGGIKGGEGRTGLILGTDFRMHSGLTFTDALVGAATTAAGLSIGWESPRDRSVFRFVLHGQYGTFDTGTTKTTGMGVTLGMSVAARREAR